MPWGNNDGCGSFLPLNRFPQFNYFAGEQIQATGVAAAFELGINFYDTADVYGGGEAERILGQALRDAGCTPSSIPR